MRRATICAMSSAVIRGFLLIDGAPVALPSFSSSRVSTIARS